MPVARHYVPQKFILQGADHGRVDGPLQKLAEPQRPLEKDLLFSATGNIFLLGAVVLPMLNSCHSKLGGGR